MDVKRRVLDEGAELREQMWLERPSGMIYLDITWAPVRDERGQVVGVYSVTIDMTDLKLAEEGLKKSEAKYESLFKGNTAVMLLIDPATGDIIDANQPPGSCGRIPFPADKDEISGDQPAPAGAGHGRDGPVRQPREKRRFNFRHMLASGEVRDVEVYSAPIEVEGRTLLYPIVHDITERIRAEKELEESEAKYRGLFENLHEGVKHLPVRVR